MNKKNWKIHVFEDVLCFFKKQKKLMILIEKRTP